MSRAWVGASRAAFVGCVIVITWASLLPPEQLPSGPDGSDTMVHALGYAILGALAVASGLRVVGAVCLAVGVGFVLEVAQRMTGYRSFEWADLAADAAGALTGALLMAILARSRQGRSGRTEG